MVGAVGGRQMPCLSEYQLQSIHFTQTLHPAQGHWEAGADPSCHGPRGGLHPNEAASPSQETHKIEKSEHLFLNVTGQPAMLVFF